MGLGVDRTVALQVHRIGGFAIVALLAWKAHNIFSALLSRRRWRRSTASYTAFTVRLGLLVTILVLGLVWSHAGSFRFLGLSGVSWHIYLSVAILPPVLWRTVFHRFNLRPRYWAERRTFLRAGALFAAGFVIWRVSEIGASLLSMPGSDRPFTGSYPAGSSPGNSFPATSWLNDRVPDLGPEEWRLSIRGQVSKNLDVTYEELSKYDRSVTAILDCTGGWYTVQEWQGAPLANLLAQAGVDDDAASITVRSATGYYRRFSMQEAGAYILATRVGGEPLSRSHGFPARLMAPGKRGYDWVKWVTAIDVNDTSKWWQPPLPLQ